MPCGTPMNIEHSSHEFTLFTHKKGKEISHDDEKNCPLKMLLNSEKKKLHNKNALRLRIYQNSSDVLRN